MLLNVRTEVFRNYSVLAIKDMARLLELNLEGMT